MTVGQSISRFITESTIQCVNIAAVLSHGRRDILWTWATRRQGCPSPLPWTAWLTVPSPAAAGWPSSSDSCLDSPQSPSVNLPQGPILERRSCQGYVSVIFLHSYLSVELPFCQVILLLSYLFAEVPFCRFIVLLSYYFAELSFCPVIFVQSVLSPKLPVSQVTFLLSYLSAK